MANRRLPVRKIKEVLRLKYDSNLSEREISRSYQVSRSTVADYLMKAKAAGISWPEALALTDTQIEERLFPVKRIPSSVKRPEPGYEYIYNQLRTYHKFNLTLVQLWLEYKEKHADGYQYSQFCDLYRRWRGKLDYVMRQEHRAGEKAFIGYSDGLSILDLVTGELILTQLFLAVWGASNYTYAEATLFQTLPEWIGFHRRSLEYFGCVPRVLVPDNLKSGVSKALQFYITNKDNKGLNWLYAYSGGALSPFIDLDLQNNDPQFMVLFKQLDVDITKIQLKWHKLMEKALDLYRDELNRQAEENEERLAALAKEEEERQAKELEEQRKRAKKKKIDEAYDTLGKPFIADAKSYLPSKEFDEFNEALEGAVEAEKKSESHGRQPILVS